ncbi:MAG: hypothetical protein E6J20_21295, partial [Chloroflexi bacterium]
MILLGTVAAGLGAWLLLGFAVGDLLLASRDAPFRGSSGDSLRTDAALLVCYVVLAMVVTLVPITARRLAGETVQRWGRGHLGAIVSLTAIVEGLLVLTWTQAAVVLTRPFFHWHDLATSEDALNGLRDQGWRLALVGAGAAVIRLLLERAALEGAPAAPGAAPAPRRRPPQRAWTTHAIQALVTVVILAGLMDTWADAAAVAAVLVGLNLVRDRAAPRLHSLARVMERYPTLPRLLGAAVASAAIAIALVRAVGATSVVRPIIVSTIVSLVIVTLVMPEHAIRAAGHSPRAEPAVPPVADGINAQPSPSPGGPAAGSVYYVTEVFDRAVARVVIGSDGRATVDPKFVSGLPPSGPDSAVFTADGRMLISNLSAGTVSVVDPTSGRVITPQLNSMPIDTLADLAVDPSGEVVWGISHSGSGPMAIDRIALNGGQVTPSNPSGVEALGGIAFSESGRLFVSSQTGMIAELSPSDGHLLQSVHVDGAPDGMTVDPQTGHLFASGCNGLCEVDVGDSPGAPMRLVRVHGAANGDGIAADGKGHIVIASDQCCLVQLTIAIDQVVTVADSIPSADDVAPVVGAGAPTAANCAALASCFGSDTGAGLGAVGVAVVLALGTTGLLRRLPDPP